MGTPLLPKSCISGYQTLSNQTFFIMIILWKYNLSLPAVISFFSQGNSGYWFDQFMYLAGILSLYAHLVSAFHQHQKYTNHKKSFFCSILFLFLFIYVYISLYKRFDRNWEEGIIQYKRSVGTWTPVLPKAVQYFKECHLEGIPLKMVHI